MFLAKLNNFTLRLSNMMEIMAKLLYWNGQMGVRDVSLIQWSVSV